MHIYGIYKNGASEPSRELVDTEGSGEGGTNGESCTDRYAGSCVDAQVVLGVKKPPANAKDVRNAGSIPSGEDPLKEDMATHSSILAWRIPRTEEAGGLQSMGSHRVGQD